jgi:hypothetical protein
VFRCGAPNPRRSGTGTEGDAVAVREFIDSQLPAYMMPATFTVLDTLPLTSSGKVDRKKLPVSTLDTSGAGGGDEHTEAGHKTLAEIWQQLLNVDQVNL